MIGASDRLSFTVFCAGALHALLILGVGFTTPNRLADIPPALEVVLVQAPTRKQPLEAEYLADMAQDGGGETSTRQRPRTPLPSLTPDQSTGPAPLPIEAGGPPEQQQTAPTVLSHAFSDVQLQLEPPGDLAPPLERQADKLTERSMEIARLTAEINEFIEAQAKRPRRKFIQARTREALAAAYMHQWVTQLERFGNLNYPEEASRNNLTGALVMAVGINADGSLHTVSVRNSSGDPRLDSAAQKIVELAAPFPRFPAELRAKTDVLYITRTWQFLNGDRLITR